MSKMKIITFFNVFNSAINGGWGNWGEWSRCSVSCGEGIAARLRVCDLPVPQFGGKPCPYSAGEQRTCNDVACRKKYILQKY